MRGLLLSCVVAGFAAMIPSSLFAAEIPVKSLIDTVTVFPSGAQITRNTQLSLEPGEHTIILKDLPREALPDSIQISGKSDGKLEIGSVDIKKIYIEDIAADKSHRQELEDKIQILKDEKFSLGGVLKAIEVQTDYLRELTRLPSSNLKKDAVAGEINLTGLFDLIGTKMQNLNAKKLETLIKQRKIDKDIKELEKKLKNQPTKRTQRTQLRIQVNAQGALTSNLQIRYQVRRAGWRPLYDARLKTTEGVKASKLSLTRLASVSQKTGEEWNNIKLLLSTTRPNRQTSAPVLRPVRIDIREQDERKGGGIGGVLNMMSNDSNLQEQAYNRSGKYAKAKLAPRMEANQIRYANVKQFAFQAVFEVPGRVNVKRKGGAKKVTLSKLDLSPTLTAIAVPKVQPVAFLSAKFRLPDGAQILTGRVNLYRDGVYIGKGYLPNLTAGRDYSLGFGADDAIQVKFAEIDRSKGETGIISTSRTDERNFKITVKNLHKWQVPVTIKDQIPYAENEKITVLQLPNTTKPSRTNLEDKRGTMAWDFDLKSGEEKQIDLAYKVVWPKEEKIYYH